MTKSEAVMTLVREGRRLRQSVESNRKIIAALKVLGVDGEELKTVGYQLELWKTNGDPYLHRDPRSPSFSEVTARWDELAGA